MSDWQKRFDKEFLNCDYTGSLTDDIKAFIAEELKQERQSMAKALRMKEWKAEVIGNVTDHVNIFIRK